MSVSKYKNFIKNIIFPKKIHEQVFVINLDNCQNEVLFSNDFNLLGKWYIKNGKHWICHSELFFEDFQTEFQKIANLSEKDAQDVEFIIDYLPFCEILGL